MPFFIPRIKDVFFFLVIGVFSFVFLATPWSDKWWINISLHDEANSIIKLIMDLMKIRMQEYHSGGNNKSCDVGKKKKKK